MKKALFTLFLISAIFGSAEAQKTKFGLKGGLNYAYLSGNDVLNISPTFEYHVGAIINIGIGDVVSFQPEFIFSVKGFDDENLDVNLNYVDVPILLKVKVADIFSLHAGPQLSYLISSETRTGSSLVEFEETITSFDLGVALGLEFELASGFTLGARYSFSVESIGEDYKYETVDPNDATKTIIENVEAPDYKNGLIQIFTAFTF